MHPFKGASSRQADSTGVKNALRRAHVNCIVPGCKLACTPQAVGPAAGGVACGICQRSESQPVAGDRLCRRACGAVDLRPDQPQGGAGHPYGCRGSIRLGSEAPARLWQASAAGGLGRGPLVSDLSGRRLGNLRAGDGDARLWPRDLLAAQLARGRSPPRVLCRGDACALSDLQFQGIQVQPGSVAARDAAACGAGLSERVRKAQREIGPVARPCRRAGADDKILGADHDRRRRSRRVDSSRPAEIPALAGAVGRHCHACRCHGSTSGLAETSGLRAADLRRRCLRPVEPRAKRSACARLYRPQSGAARSTGGAGCDCAGMAFTMDDPGAATAGLVCAGMAARRKSDRECIAGAQHLDHPDRGRDRPAARRPDFHGLHEDRLGDFAVLSDPAGAGGDSLIANPEDRAVSYCRDLAHPYARGAGRLALHRRGRDGTLPKRSRDLWRALAARPRTDPGMALAFQHAMGRCRRHHGGWRADDVLQFGSSGAVHAGRALVVRVDFARGGEASRVHRYLRYDGRAAAGLRSLDEGEWQGRRAPCDHHAALLPRPSRPADQLEDLYRAAGEMILVHVSPQKEARERTNAAARTARTSWAGHADSSLNLLATRSVIASRAACASGPTAETMMDVPGPADSIINPMMEVPPTVSAPRVTQTSASKRSTIWTNFAEARACKPRLLIMGSSRVIAPEGMLGPALSCGAAPSSLICPREPGWQW